MSLTATTSRSVRSSARRVNVRPIRPKPLMATLVVMLFPPRWCPPGSIGLSAAIPGAKVPPRPGSQPYRPVTSGRDGSQARGGRLAVEQLELNLAGQGSAPLKEASDAPQFPSLRLRGVRPVGD